MITFLVVCAAIWLMFRVFRFGVKAAWSVAKILFALVLIPVAAIGILSVGLIGLIIIVAVVGGIVGSAFRRPM